MKKAINRIREVAYNNYKKLEIKDNNLLYLFLEITRNCNLNCLHCGSDCKADKNAPELTTESWIKIIDYFADKFSEELIFIITGGEPTLHTDLLKITKHIQNRKRRWGMVTNGMTLSDEKLNNYIENGLYSLTVSFDGLEEPHNKLRNHLKAYSKVINALEIIGNSSLKFKDAVTCVYPDNLDELEQIAEILFENKINSWRLFRIFPSGRAFKNPVTQLSFEQTQKMLEKVKALRKKYNPKGLNINLSCEGWLPFKEDVKLRDNPFFCRAGVNIASVLCDGNITGCSNNHESFYQGNILKDDFSYLWENKFSDFRERNWLKTTKCNDCEHIKKCRGSSIHLWELGQEYPKFCYVKDLETYTLCYL